MLGRESIFACKERNYTRKQKQREDERGTGSSMALPYEYGDNSEKSEAHLNNISKLQLHTASLSPDTSHLKLLLGRMESILMVKQVEHAVITVLNYLYYICQLAITSVV
jgi:hypothetical protein